MLAFLSLTASAQIYSAVDYEKYIDKDVVINPQKISRINTVHGFHKNLSQYSYLDTIVYAYNNYETKADSLKGIKFTIMGFIPNERRYGHFYVKLYSKKTNIIYYDLEGDLLKSSIVPVEYLEHGEAYKEEMCGNITQDIDRYRDTKTFSTPYAYDDYSTAYFSKIIDEKGTSKYYIFLYTKSPIAKGNTGLFIIFKNGNKISLPLHSIDTEIDNQPVDILHPGFIRKTSLEITSKYLPLFKASPIDGFEMVVDKGGVSNSDDLQQMFLCLLNKI